MKRLLDRIKRGKGPAAPGGAASEDTGFFSSVFQESVDAPQTVSSWRDRAPQLRAEPADRPHCTELFAQLWGADRHVVALTADELQRMSHYMEFVRVPVGQEVIGQDELGDYMVIVLDGTLSVDRAQPWGGKARLAEAHAGDMLGEMSLLDAGARFSSCGTLTPCTLAVVEARRLDEMIAREPRLGVALLASLSRRLSLRLRQVSARLSALLSQN
ncbi:cyclic nucleotide-binding domain-containing protein [Piscinibacter sp.]|uniref:cyclic nucleotide-binding domain-containing protein n=1 Tax=Piscinibacter sp. TaxID=1903157 RepID=UPI002C8F8956|nr:cyclic nucleotide-binding domain-containing protein [Albitalea sp.]HUG22890.1 cyclic nucleotide-binding domain-containing protein [Albitalea sp.]